MNYKKKHNKIKRLVITTGALLLLAGSPIVQNNSLGEYMNTMTGTITAQAAELPSQQDGWDQEIVGKYQIMQEVILRTLGFKMMSQVIGIY